MSRRLAWWAAGILSVLAAGTAIVLTPWGSVVPADPLLMGQVFDAREIARAERFSTQVRWASYAALASGLLASIWLGLSGPGLRLVRRATGWLRWWWLRVAGVVVVLMVAAWLVALPFRIRHEAVLREWGLSTQDWGDWLADRAKGLALTIVLTSVGLILLVGLARLLPRWWWAPASIAAAVMVFAMSFAYPVVVEPVFNSFQPMEKGELRSELMALARRDGVDVDDVLVADASRRTTSLNAYVSGLGSTSRIVVYDTLLENAPPAQIRSIVAHELGHAENDDVLAGSAMGAAVVAAAVVGLSLAIGAPFFRRRGIDGMGDPLAAAAVLALFSALSLAGSPIESVISRQVEARADYHALQLTRDPEALIDVQQTLAEANLSDIDPPRVAYVMFASHPTPLERITMAREWAEQHPDVAR